MAIGFYIFYKYLFTYIAPFVLGWILSILYNPLVNALNKKLKFPRWFGTIISIFVLLGFFISIGYGIFIKVMQEAKLFADNLPQYLNMVEDALFKINKNIDKLIILLPFGIKEFFINGNNWFADIISAAISLFNPGAGSVNFFMKIPSSIMLVVISIISSFFFSKDKYVINATFQKYMPKGIYRLFSSLKRDLFGAVAGYFKTQCILMSFTFVICIIGLNIFKSPYALLLAVIIALIDALPFFGSGFILWPAAVISGVLGNYKIMAGYIIIYLIVMLMRQIMEPKVLGTQIGIHPLLTLICMYVGLKILGVFGMILGPLTGVLIKAALEVKIKIDNEKSE